VPLEPDVGGTRKSLSRLTRATQNIRAARTIDDALAAAAAEARALLDTHIAVVRFEVAAGRTCSRVSLSEKYATLTRVPETRLEYLEAPLFADDGSASGTIKVADPPRGSFGAGDTELLAQLAHVTAMALERVRPAARSTAPGKAGTCDDIVAMVSHDIRSPLNMISMSAGLLRRDVAAPSIALVDTIEKSVTRMNTLLGDLADAGSIAESTLSLTRLPERASAIVREAADVAAQLASAHACAIETDARSIDEELEIVADRPRLTRVLFHLLRNAIQSSPKGGRVKVGVTASERNDGSATFFVIDEGPGIPADRLAAIFERHSTPRTESRKGIGLGLFVARGVVEAHGGCLRIESDAAGTTVLVEIPATRPGP